MKKSFGLSIFNSCYGNQKCSVPVLLRKWSTNNFTFPSQRKVQESCEMRNEKFDCEKSYDRKCYNCRLRWKRFAIIRVHEEELWIEYSN
jgi:hypothetical protein